MKIIDQFLPQWDFRSRHSSAIDTQITPDASILYEIDLRESIIIRILFFLRGLPLKRHRITEFFEVGFHLLDESQQEIVFGLISQPWKFHGSIRNVEPKGFIEFHERGFVKVATNFFIDKLNGEHVLISTETRISANSRKARIYFGIYWTIIRFLSGLVRKEILKLVKQRFLEKELKTPMTDLNHKVAVVTGSANGLGKALATELFNRGWHLALMDTDFAGLEKLKSQLHNDDQIVSIHFADVSREDQINTARVKILQVHKHIDLLINNAGVSISRLFDQMALDDFKHLFDINFWGTVYCTRHFLPDIMQQNGHLVNVVSNFALMGFPGKTAYGSSKSAVMGFTYSLKTELARKGLKISLVIPPPLSTGLIRNSKHIDDNKRKKEVEFVERHSVALDKAAKKIISKVMAGRFRILIGPMIFWIDLVSRLFPSMFNRMIGRFKDRLDFV